MATGFVTTQNLSESNTGSLDRSILDNLGGPGITDDILLFDGNSRFVSRLVLNQDAIVLASDFLPGVQYRITDLGSTSPADWHLAAGTQSGDSSADLYHADYVVYDLFTRSTTVIANIGSGKAIGRLADDFTVGDEASDYQITVGTEGKVAFSNGTKLSMSGTLPLGVGEGFIDYADAVSYSAAKKVKLGIVDMWDGLTDPSSSEITVNKVGTGVTYSANGFVADNNGSFIKYATSSFSVLNPQITVNGYTLQYEIENGVFATNYNGGDKPVALVFSNTQWQMNATTDYNATFSALTFGVANADSAAAKTAIENCVGSTLTVVDGADDSHSTGKTLITLSSTTAKYANATKKDAVNALTLVGATVSFADGSAKWGISDASGDAITQTIETANLAPMGTHSLITISVQGSAGPEPYKISIYKDKSLILEARKSDPNHPDLFASTTEDLYIGGKGTAANNPNPTHRIKNVMYIAGATIPRRNLRIAVLGDDNISFGQYQADTSEMQNPMPNGAVRQGGMHSYKVGDPLFDAVTPYGAAPHPLHNPPLHGIRQNSRYPVEYLPSTGNRVDDTGAAATEYLFHREESLFARMEYYLANKGLHPTAFAPNQLGIYSAARSDAKTGDINDQIDAMLGAAPPDQGPGSIGSNRSLDVVVINLGTNDAYYGSSADNTALAALAKDNLKNGVDRIISVFDPKAIVVNTVAMPLLINGSATGIPNTNQQAAAADISAKVVELDGYRDVVAVVNLATALDTSGRQTGFADALHYNPKGYDIMAAAIVDKLHFIFATELSESSSYVYDVTDSNGLDKFSVKYNGDPVNVSGTLRRNDAVTKTNMEFLNVKRFTTSSGNEDPGDNSVSAFESSTFSEHRDFIEENLTQFVYKSKRVPFTQRDSVFYDDVAFAGTVRIIDTDQSAVAPLNNKPGIFMVDVTDSSAEKKRAFSDSSSEWAKSNVDGVAGAALSNAPIIDIGLFVPNTFYEIADLGTEAAPALQNNWNVAAGTSSNPQTYAVGNIFKAAAAGASASGNAKELGVEKNIDDLDAGSKYTITDLGTSQQANWDIAAGTTSVTYVVGSTFTATAAGAALSSGDGKAALLDLTSKNAKVTTLTIADATNRNVVIETFENTQLVEGTSSVLAISTFTHKLPVLVNGETYYMMLRKE